MEIICYCLLPNHFHLLLKQIRDGGIQKFLQKFLTGYTKYFNLKNERRGHLFQDVFRAVPILEESHFSHISRYIYLNALDLFEPSWREGQIKDWNKCKKFLENYPWSSYPSFKNNFSSESSSNIFKEDFRTAEDYENFLREWAGREKESIELLLES